MTPDQIRRTNRVLEAQSPDAPPLRFAFTPNDGMGAAQLLVDRERVPTTDLMALLQRGTRTIVEGTISRTADGFLAFTSPGLNEKRLASLVTTMSPSFPIVTGARLG